MQPLDQLTDTQIDDLCYEVFADKTLSFGCRLFDREYGEITFVNIEYYDDYDAVGVSTFYLSNGELCDFVIDDRCKIIGHPPMYGDVIHLLEQKGIDYYHKDSGCGCCSDEVDNEGFIKDLRTDKRLPLTSQSRECKEFCLRLKYALDSNDG